MISIKEYVDRAGGSPFARWFNRLDVQAAARVATALIRMEQGNLSGIRSVGAGVSEYRIDFGPGYRLYLGRDGEALVVLLGGGTKRRQRQDIETAGDRWRDYKRRKRREARKPCP